MAAIVHLHMPIFWTACNMSSRQPSPSQLDISKNKSLATCGNCKRTQAFFSRDGDPTAKIMTRYKVKKDA